MSALGNQWVLPTGAAFDWKLLDSTSFEAPQPRTLTLCACTSGALLIGDADPVHTSIATSWLLTCSIGTGNMGCFDPRNPQHFDETITKSDSRQNSGFQWLVYDLLA